VSLENGLQLLDDTVAYLTQQKAFFLSVMSVITRSKHKKTQEAEEFGEITEWCLMYSDCEMRNIHGNLNFPTSTNV